MELSKTINVKGAFDMIFAAEADLKEAKTFGDRQLIGLAKRRLTNMKRVLFYMDIEQDYMDYTRARRSKDSISQTSQQTS